MEAFILVPVSFDTYRSVDRGETDPSSAAHVAVMGVERFLRESFQLQVCFRRGFPPERFTDHNVANGLVIRDNVLSVLT